jgi:hypothetical protein
MVPVVQYYFGTRVKPLMIGAFETAGISEPKEL